MDLAIVAYSVLNKNLSFADVASSVEDNQSNRCDRKTMPEENIKQQAYETLEKDNEYLKNQLQASQNMVYDLKGREQRTNELLAQLQFRSEIENEKMKLEILLLNEEIATQVKEKLAVEDQLNCLKDNAREFNSHISELHQQILWQEQLKERESELKEKVIKEKVELFVEVEEKTNEIMELKNELTATNGQIRSLEGQVTALEVTLGENMKKLNKRKGWRRFKCW